MTNAVNKKYKIAIIALAIGVIIMLGAVIGVWAATSQKVNVGFNVHYDVGDNVGVEVRTEYYVPNLDSNGDGQEDGVHIVTTNTAGATITNDKGYVPFNVGDAQGEKDLNIDNVALSAKAQKIEYYFTFHSLLDAKYIQVAFWTEFETKNNVLVDYWYAYADKTFDVTTSASTIAKEEWSLNQLDNVSPEGYKFIKVVLEVGNQNAKASSKGEYNFILNHAGDNLQSVSTLSKDKLQNHVTTENGYDFDGNELSLKYTNQDMNNIAGVDVSEAGDGSIKMDGNIIWSKNTICLPENSSGIFSFYVLVEVSLYPFVKYNFQNIDTSNVKYMDSIFTSVLCSFVYGSIEKFDTSSVTTMSGMFNNYNDGLSGNDEIDLTQFNTQNVVNMSAMFDGCQAKRIYVSDLWSIEKVTNSEDMFAGCRATGAVEHDSTLPYDKTMANWETGYLTYKPY